MICCFLVFLGYQPYSKYSDKDDKPKHKNRFVIKNAKDAMIYYGKIRTKDGKGVTIPSQIRYVYYFDHFLKLLLYHKKQLQANPDYKNRYLSIKLCEMKYKMPKVVMKLYKVRIITTPNIKNGGWTPSFKIFCKYTLFYDSLSPFKDKFTRLYGF